MRSMVRVLAQGTKLCRGTVILLFILLDFGLELADMQVVLNSLQKTVLIDKAYQHHTNNDSDEVLVMGNNAQDVQQFITHFNWTFN